VMFIKAIFWGLSAVPYSFIIIPDNGMMESFFGILKSEMFYGYEKTFKSLNQLEQAIVDYNEYYNNKRIKVKLKRA